MTDKLSIPEIRKRLQALIAKQDELIERQLEIANELAALVPHMFRRQAKKHARTAAKRITPDLADRIREFALANPDMPNRDIGRVFGVDGGRVSEVLHGIK